MAGPITLTEVDFEQIKSNLINYLKSTKQFTDFDFDGSNLQVILNLISYQAQLNAYSTNLIANESFLDSSSIRKNVVSNARSLGYVPVSAKSAQSLIDFEFQLDVEDYPGGLPTFGTLTPGMAFSTNTGMKNFTFNLIDSQVGAFNNSGLVKFYNVPIYEGTYLTHKFTVDNSNYDQRFVLQNKNIDSNTIRVEVQENPTEDKSYFYKQATNIVELTKESRIYWLEEVDQGFYELTFGDGSFGKALVDGSVINVTYLICNGPDANGIQGTDNFRFVGGLFDSNGTRIRTQPEVITVSTTSGGAEIESVESIKYRAPRDYAAQNRCVIAEDYDALIRRVFPAVDDIYVYGGETLEIPEFGRVYCAIKPRTGDTLSNITKSYIKKSLNPYRVASLDIKLVDPQVLYIEIDSLVYYNEKVTVKDASKIKADVIDALNGYVSATAIPRFGGVVRYSKILGIIDDADQAITRNNTSMRMRKDMRIVPNTMATYEVCFEQPIQPNKEETVVYSTGFNLEIAGTSDSRVFYFENDPKTVRQYSEEDLTLISDIYCFYFNEFNEKVRVDFYKNKFDELIVIDQLGADKEVTPFGTVYFDRGEIEIAYKFKNGVNFTGTVLDSNKVEIRSIPKEVDISAKESVFLELDVSKSDIEVVVDLKLGGS